MKSYWGRWSLIFGRNLKWKFGCTSTSKISMSYHSNQTCRVCFKILGTCRFWNCHCFLDLIMISWRNHCLENVYLTCERGITPSFVPLDLHFSVYCSAQSGQQSRNKSRQARRNYKIYRLEYVGAARFLHADCHPEHIK